MKFPPTVTKMAPAQPEAQVSYLTQAWCVATRGASNAVRDQSRTACTPGICGPPTGGDPRDPNCTGTQPTGRPPGARAHTWEAMHNETSGERSSEAVQRRFRDVSAKGLLRNQKCGHTENLKHPSHECLDASNRSRRPVSRGFRLRAWAGPRVAGQKPRPVGGVRSLAGGRAPTQTSPGMNA